MATHHSNALRVVILGSTGSIGTQTCAVIAHCNALHKKNPSHPCFQIVGLAANTNADALKEQATQLGITDLALCDTTADIARDNFALRRGPDAARQLIQDTQPDLVVAAIVGIAGLESTLYAVENGIDVALANKESLVAAGELVIKAAQISGSRILPIDSEHAGVWQCLLGIMPANYTPPAPINTAINRVTLTASGGPFRQWSAGDIANATPEDALKHPNWSMGAKVTIDSATLMNKGLELIEAHWLFGLGADQLDAMIHPQSIIHAFVECADHSVLAQLGAPDMRCPIQHALCFPHRIAGISNALDLSTLSQLDFEPIDHTKFPAVQLALDAIVAGGTAGAILNAANEIAVHAFLNHQINFSRLTEIVAQTVTAIPPATAHTLAAILDADAAARAHAQQLIAVNAGGTR